MGSRLYLGGFVLFSSILLLTPVILAIFSAYLEHKLLQQQLSLHGACHLHDNTMPPIASPSNSSNAAQDPAAEDVIVQQVEAFLASQAIPNGPAATTGLDQDDLLSQEAEEDGPPPPAYGTTYGEIRNEKDGLGTSAQVTDDGRVNIHINQLNRRLSQIFNPAISQHIRNEQDSPAPPPPYIPPSLGGKDGVPPPTLSVVMQVVGSRGDVQPFVALGKVLKETYGHRVRLATHPNFQKFVEENGLEFFSIGGDPSQLMAFMVKNPSLMPGFRSLVGGDVSKRRRDVAEYIQGCWRSCYQAGDGMPRSSYSKPPSPSSETPFVADCIIANPPSFAHIHCAEKLGVPLHIMFTMPYSPTQAFPHPLANIQSSNADPNLTSYISYSMIEILSWQGLGDIINRFRAKCLGLDPVSLVWAPGMLQRLKIPHTYCWSPALIPKPQDWGSRISIAGFYFLDLAPNYTPADDLQTFLNSGPPPVYIGFGSIVLEDPDGMTDLIFEAVRKTGQRVLLSKGWGGMGANELNVPEGVFMLGNVPHDWLFKHVSCVVHHGGAGTTAAGIAAGRPTLVVPFFGDQPFWGSMVARAGAGPDPIPHKLLTASKLADAINFCLKPESLQRAKELADKIAAEKGSDVGAQMFHQYLEPDRLRCTLAPSRVAVWRIRRTQVKLSTFAACTLANENLLDFNSLKLFRAEEYETDGGPWDPISGAFVSACEAFAGMGLGLADIPTETVKAVQLPFRNNKQKNSSSSSSSTIETATLEQNASSPSIDQSTNQTSPPQSRSSLPGPSGRGSVSSHTDVSSGQDRDMMRHRGAHGSKGIGRFTKALVKGPMEISMSLTKGMHNLPKHWGDDTVRPHAKVTDFSSGAKTAGKEFGIGWYDGITGLVTQPWRGGKKDGATGVLKGIGKGMGGFIAKPFAGTLGILGYTMKGVHKELQKLFGSNVQNYIVASRATQGYEDWLQSSDEEKQDVIAGWKLIQKYVKKKHSPEEMMQDMLERRQSTQETRVASLHERVTTASSHPVSGAGDSLQDNTQGESDGRPQLSTNAPVPAEEIVVDTPIQAIDLEAQDDPVPAGASTMHTQIQATGWRVPDRRAVDDEEMRRAMKQSQLEADFQAQRRAEYDAHLQQITAQSLREHRNGGSGINKAEDGSSHDRGHLMGTTQREFEMQQDEGLGEKTAKEKVEEDIVMEYIKKQSLLEQHHKNNGKARAAMSEEQADEEDLKKALELSMQDFAAGTHS